MDELFQRQRHENGNERNRPASLNTFKSNKLETMVSAKNLHGKGNIKKNIGKERVNKLFGLLYTKT